MTIDSLLVCLHVRRYEGCSCSEPAPYQYHKVTTQALHPNMGAVVKAGKCIVFEETWRSHFGVGFTSQAKPRHYQQVTRQEALPISNIWIIACSSLRQVGEERDQWVGAGGRRKGPWPCSPIHLTSILYGEPQEHTKVSCIFFLSLQLPTSFWFLSLINTELLAKERM